MKSVDTISVVELSKMAEAMYGDLVKVVVDLVKNSMVVDAEMHADEEAYLLENGSQQADLWGINLYPAKFGTDEFIEFDSMINIRPRQQNMSRSVEDADIRRQIIELVQAESYGMNSNYTVDQGKWAQLDIFNQMGNIYSEVGRSFKASKQADTKTRDAAIARAIDLFDATVQAQIAAKSPKAREVLRAKEQFLTTITTSADRESILSLDRYFMQFAIAARLNR